LVRAASLLALASVLHLQYAGMLVALLLATTVLAMQQSMRSALHAAGAQLATIAAVAAATFWFFRGERERFFVGSVFGGADGRLLVPLVDAQGELGAPGTLLGPDHLALVAHIVLFAIPFAVPLAVASMVAISTRRSSWQRAGWLPLSLPTTAWFAFVATFGFDLGWPGDADLMLTMAAAPLLPIGVCLANGVRGRVTMALAGAVAAIPWCVIGPLIRPNWQELSPTNTAAATFTIAGRGALGERGPIVLPTAVGATLTLSAGGPPDYEFWILRAPLAPANAGHPYGAVTDLRLPLALTADWFVHVGRLDHNGQGSASWVVQPLADGTLPALQMLVMPPGQPTAGTTSASFALVPR
jgi:hypothetical protein